MRLTPVGDAALLAAFDDPDLLDANRRVRALEAALLERRPAGLLDLIPAYRTLLVHVDPLVWPPDVASRFVHAATQALDLSHSETGRVVELPVRYGGAEGPDLPAVAAHTGLSEAEVTTLHATPLYLVMFIGFMPGFPYLWGMDPRLATPRLATPRLRVPARSVGIGGDQTGVYSTESPGGWRLIGRAALDLYDPSASPPTLLRAGDRVRFIPLA